MKTSENIAELTKAMVEVQKSIVHPSRDKVSNPTYRAKYADLTKVIESCRLLLTENHLFFTQPTEERDGVTVLITRISHTSGQWMEGELKLNPEKNTPQGLGSAITYARRYSLTAMIGLAPEDEDDDGEAAENRPPVRRQETATKKDTQPSASSETTESGEIIKHWADGDAKRGDCAKCDKKNVFCYIEGGLCYDCKHQG